MRAATLGRGRASIHRQQHRLAVDPPGDLPKISPNLLGRLRRGKQGTLHLAACQMRQDVELRLSCNAVSYDVELRL